VPTVIALIGGQVAPLFQGVLPKDQVQAAIDQLLKAAVAERDHRSGRTAGGAAPEEPAEGDEPVPDPRFAAADEGPRPRRLPAAVAEFDKLLAANPGDTEAQVGKAQAGSLPGRPASTPGSCWPQRRLTPASASSWTRPMSRWSTVTSRPRSIG
jgi:putative thioredoxin